MLPYYRIFIVNAFLILKFSYTEVLQYHKNDSLIQKITRHCKDNKNKTCIEDSPRGLAVPVTKTVTKTRPIEKCCEGYFAKRDKCLPQCSIQCENSTCTRPNECTCNPGYKPTADNHRFVTFSDFLPHLTKESLGVSQYAEGAMNSIKIPANVNQFVIHHVPTEYVLDGMYVNAISVIIMNRKKELV